MAKTNTTKGNAKAIRRYVEGKEAARMDFLNFERVATSAGLDVEYQPGRDNDGWEIKYPSMGHGYRNAHTAFVFDNSGRAQYNVAVRISHGLDKQRFPWATWKKRTDMKITEDGDKLNTRIACYSRDALESVMIKLLVAFVADLKAAAKKDAAKATDKAVKGGAA